MAAVLKKEEQNKQNSRVFTIFSRLFHVWKTGFQILFQEFNTLQEAYQKSSCLLVTVTGKLL